MRRAGPTPGPGFTLNLAITFWTYRTFPAGTSLNASHCAGCKMTWVSTYGVPCQSGGGADVTGTGRVASFPTITFVNGVAAYPIGSRSTVAPRTVAPTSSSATNGHSFMGEPPQRSEERRVGKEGRSGREAG